MLTAGYGKPGKRFSPVICKPQHLEAFDTV
jgi:hypothetical protein